ncbi:MAG: hypothetical protein IJN25_07065 [Clostridia bacterium]|nr:hypothetical protein [Oscillospiraceae bacterium]MBQ7033399.1 hypothetical protein [Clostridia bacterium]
MTEKPQGFRKKIENFWYHYKIVVFIVLFFAFSATYLLIDVIQKQNPDMVLAYVSDTYGDESQFARAEDAISAIIGDINGDGTVKLNYRMMAIRDQNLLSYDVDREQGFNYSFLDKNVRLYIIKDIFFEDKKLFFEPLEGLVSEESLAGGLTNEDGEICAVPLAGKPVAETMDFSRPELYVGIKRIMDTEKHDKLVYTQHEKAKEVLKYIVEGETE